MSFNLEILLFLVIALIPPLFFVLTRSARRNDGERTVSAPEQVETPEETPPQPEDSVLMRWQLHRYEAVFDSLEWGVGLVDGRGAIRIANPRFYKILDIRTGSPSGTASLGPGRFQSILDIVDEVLEKGKMIPKTNLELSTNSGAPIVVQVDAIPLASAQVRFPEVVLQVRDVTSQHHQQPSAEREELVDGFQKMIGRGKAMRQVFDLLTDIRDTDSSVLITGESGTGKELVAEALHATSLRANGPMVKVNCAALSETLLESELFGHVRGAYTGAVADRVGRFEAARGGTLFLDEIAELSPRLQTKLLRVLQVGEFERVGETRTIHTDARIITATNRNLMEEMEQGLFRRDLYYRLNVINVQLPPLRERKEDIPLLAERFVQRYGEEMGKPVLGIHEEAMEVLVSYDWPGNVRELENAMHRAVVIGDGHELLVRHLPSEIWAGVKGSSQQARKRNNRKPLDEQRIRDALDQQNWVVARVARQLGISRNYLYQKLEEYSISRPE